MLELKSYTINELANELNKNASRQSLKKCLDRYEVTYEIEGRGSTCIFKIQSIKNSFKVFCITELNIPATSDFDRMLYFYHSFLGDEEFSNFTNEEMQDYLDKNYERVSRQTIRHWIGYLEEAGWYQASCDYIYYFSKEGTHFRTTKEKYCEAWKLYFYYTYQGEECGKAMGIVYQKYNGVPRKKAIMQQNIFYTEKLEAFMDVICGEVEKKIKTTENL